MGVFVTRGDVRIISRRNYRTSIAVAAFSTRARPNGAISVPVRWEELNRIKQGDQWNVGNIRDRLRRLREDPWREFWSARQRLGNML